MSARWFPGLALAFLALLPTTATAATIDFHVVNGKGIAQAQVSVESSGRHLYGNGAGEVSVGDLQPGDTVYFSRQLQESSDPCVTAPEGKPGIAYTVPNPAPSSATVTLPAPAFQPYEPGLSDRERGLVGLINDERRAHGLAPLVISTVLDEATDGYLAYAPTAPGASSAAMHCSLYGVRLREIDAGYPVGNQLGENIVWAATATDAFNWWMQSPVHRENILNPNWTAIGIASKGSTFLTDFATTDLAFTERAGLTGDYGDASLADKSSTSVEDVEAQATQRNPGLSFKLVKVHGQRLRVKVNIAADAAAEGHLLVVARHGKQKRVLRLSQLEAHGQLSAGHWTVEARFAHGSRAEFLNTRIARRVQVKGGASRH
jgi:uncharacterized protein YkwD